MATKYTIVHVSGRRAGDPVPEVAAMPPPPRFPAAAPTADAAPPPLHPHRGAPHGGSPSPHRSYTPHLGSFPQPAFPFASAAAMGVMGKVKLGVSDLHVSRYGLGSMTWGIQNTEEEAYVGPHRRACLDLWCGWTWGGCPVRRRRRRDRPGCRRRGGRDGPPRGRGARH